jgi:dihydrofolate reductase
LRKIVAEIGLSSDGFIEGPNGELDWLITRRDPVYTTSVMKRFDTIFYGRLAYEKFGLPSQMEYECSDAEREYNNTVNDMRKFVFSRTMRHVPGNGMVIYEDVEGNVERIRDEQGKDIWLCGGASMISSLAILDMIDEYVLIYHPVMLGAGKRLFRHNTRKAGLVLLSSRTLKSGIIISNYKPGNRIKSFYRYDRSF